MDKKKKNCYSLDSYQTKLYREKKQKLSTNLIYYKLYKFIYYKLYKLKCYGIQNKAT